MEWIPSLIHNASGWYIQIVAKDINQDGRIQIVTTARKGTFVFHGPFKAGTSARGLMFRAPAALLQPSVSLSAQSRPLAPRTRQRITPLGAPTWEARMGLTTPP